MREDIKEAMEYELLVRRNVAGYMTPLIIGFFLFLAGILAMIPIAIEDGDLYFFLWFFIMAYLGIHLYKQMSVRIPENSKVTNTFSKYRLIPVKKSTLLKGKAALLTRFVLRCTIVFLMLNWGIRLLAGFELLCIEAFLPLAAMIVIYAVELTALWNCANKM